MRVQITIDTTAGSIVVADTGRDALGKVGDFLTRYANAWPVERFFYEDGDGRRFEAPYGDVERIDISVEA
jgi:hypothetical protein